MMNSFTNANRLNTWMLSRAIKPQATNKDNPAQFTRAVHRCLATADRPRVSHKPSKTF